MPRRLVGLVMLVVVLTTGIYLYVNLRPRSARALQVFAWMRNPDARPEVVMHAGERCGESPFVFPTDGVVGFLWDDSFRLGHRHQGIDIFSGAEPGVTPVIAAYDGYLTRLAEWKSSVIMRVPQDPLQRGRQIWIYYTHLADEDGSSYVAAAFPPGTTDVFVEAGTLLGYQGNYSGDPYNPVGVHLHLSIVQSDVLGRFKNELDIENTLDPSPYLGLPVNARQNPDEIPVCS